MIEPTVVNEIKELFSTTHQIKEVLNNLLIIRDNVNKFGVTKQLLHLVNSNNNLSSAIELQLPYYENDQEDINEKDIPSSEVFIESLNETINKYKEKFKNMLDVIKEKIKHSIQNLDYDFSSKKKQIELLKTRIENVDENKICNFYSFNGFESFVDNILKYFQSTPIVIKGTESKCPSNNWELCCEFGYYISQDKDTKEVHGNKTITRWGNIKLASVNSNIPEKKKDKSLKELQWIKSNLMKCYNSILRFPTKDAMYEFFVKLDKAYDQAYKNYPWVKSEDWNDDVKKYEYVVALNIENYYETCFEALLIMEKSVPKVFDEYISFLKRIA